MLQFWLFWTQSDTLLIKQVKNTVCRLRAATAKKTGKWLEKMAVKKKLALDDLTWPQAWPLDPVGLTETPVMFESIVFYVKSAFSVCETTSKIPAWFVNGRFDEFYMILIIGMAVSPSNLIPEVFFEKRIMKLKPF